MSAGSPKFTVSRIAALSLVSLWLAGCTSSSNPPAPVTSVDSGSSSNTNSGMLITPPPKMGATPQQAPQIQPVQRPVTQPMQTQPVTEQPVQMENGRIVYNRQYGNIPKGSYTGGSTYTVKKGDTLFYIAWIRQTIERAIMNQTRTIRLPIHIVKELNVYLRTARELSHKLDHEPSAEEIAEQLDKPVDDVSRMLRLNERITSVDTPLGGDSEKALLDILADEKENGPEDTTQDDDMKQSIVKWLFELNAKQREVLARRFGLLGYEAATLEDVGREIGLTRERVRQIQVEGLRRLREILQTQGLNIEALFRE